MQAARSSNDRQLRPSRMSLANVKRGIIDQPLRVLLYGVDGVGKSSWGAAAPSPIFLGAEDGTSTLDVARMPTPRTWDELLDGVHALAVEDHEFKTLVVDSLDWCEPLAWAHVCKRDGKLSIEDYGFGKGYVAALDLWREFLAALDELRAKRGMHVVLLAHSHVKSFKNPEGEDFDRYEPKLHAKASGLIREWADAVLFATYETFAKTDQKTKRTRGLSTGARLAHTTRTAAFDAKNRHDLPPSIPLDWEAFWAATRKRQVAPTADLVAAIEGIAAKLDEKTSSALKAAIDRDRADGKKLAALLNKAEAALSRVEATTQETDR